MNKRMIEWEQEALFQRNSGNVENAMRLFQKIIQQDPNYEFGMIFYNLACCLEDLGKFEEAEKNFREALKYNPEDVIRWDGLASFLYLHGNHQDAFHVYLHLLHLEKKSGSNLENLILALRTLGKKINLSDRQIALEIEEILNPSN